MLMYWKQAKPHIKRVSYLLLAAGETAAANSEISTVRKVIEDQGFVWAGVVEAPPTVTDFTPSFLKLRDQHPDAIYSNVDGGQSAILQSQWPNSGLANTVTLCGADALTGVTAAQANGFEFAFDYFNTADPGNDWGRLFASEYLRMKGSWPTFPYYVANYYETTFLLWDLVRRVIATGGDPTKQGDHWITAFNQNPSFPSVYATSGSHGTNVFSTETHTLTKRLMTVGVYDQLTPKVLATFYTGGENFTLTGSA
jgi:hypothetical protein